MPSGGWTHRWTKPRGTATCVKCGTVRTEIRDRDRSMPLYEYKSAAGKYLGGYASKCPGKRRNYKAHAWKQQSTSLS